MTQVGRRLTAVRRRIEDRRGLDGYLREVGAERLFLVCGGSIRKLELGAWFDTLEARTGIRVVRFSGFRPNPAYEDTVKAVEAFRSSGCDAIAAVGGGSAIDTAKCVKLWAGLDPSRDYLQQEIVPNDIPFLAIPTTAGTGSEATRFAVIYYHGEKRSVAHESCIPSAVLLDPGTLESLPEYHRGASMLDALCHAVESSWSVKATEESRAFSRRALHKLWEHVDGYLSNTRPGNAGMLEAADLAGKAIDRAQTTAGHAMSYKLTTLYGIAHGHAAALCVAKLWPYMAERAEGTALGAVFQDLAEAMGCETVPGSIEKFQGLLARLGLGIPAPRPADFEILERSVDPVRLENNPVPLEPGTIDRLYHQILREEETA